MSDSVCHVPIGVFEKAAFCFVSGSGRIVTKFLNVQFEVLNA